MKRTGGSRLEVLREPEELELTSGSMACSTRDTKEVLTCTLPAMDVQSGRARQPGRCRAASMGMLWGSNARKRSFSINDP